MHDKENSSGWHTKICFFFFPAFATAALLALTPPIHVSCQSSRISRTLFFSVMAQAPYPTGRQEKARPIIIIIIISIITLPRPARLGITFPFRKGGRSFGRPGM